MTKTPAYTLIYVSLQTKDRIATVIAYLATMDLAETGFTAFPCLLPKGQEYDQDRNERAQMCRKAARSGATSYVVGEKNREVDYFGMLVHGEQHTKHGARR